MNLVEAQYKYRDFINRYPDQRPGRLRDAAIAMCSFKQMERPDRDQQKTREARREVRRHAARAIRTARSRRRRRRGGRRRWTVWRGTSTSWRKFYMKRGS